MRNPELRSICFISKTDYLFLAISSLLILVFLHLTIRKTFAEECIYIKPKVSVEYPTIVKQENIAECTFKEIEEIEKAENVLKKFWIVSHKNKYELFSESHKKRLNKFHNIKNSDEYVKSFST